MSISGWAACLLLVIPVIVSAIMLWASAGICAEPSTCQVMFNPVRSTISVDMEHADIADVADTIAEKTGAKVLLDRSLQRKITAKFSEIPLEQGIRRLLEPTSTAFEFTKITAGSGPVRYHLDSVRIFDSGKPSPEYKTFSSEKPKAYIAPEPQDKAMTRHYLRNLETARRINQDRIQDIRREMVQVSAELSREKSPEKRNMLLGRMENMKSRITQIYTMNTRIIQSEERNIKELAAPAGMSESRRKFMKRQEDARRQQASAVSGN